MEAENKIDKLQEEINRRITDIKSDSITMSIGELASLYNDKELIIRPEFQRFYRWTEEQKSKLIESILLGIPLPSIFVSQDETGVWTVIDGLQRLSTIFQFMGILKNSTPLKLMGTKYLPSLNDKVWESDIADSLNAAQRIFIKRARMDVKVILRQSDNSAHYEIFQRLNTGGTSLTEQEIRNAVLLMENANFYKWIEEISIHESFKNTVTEVISENQREQQYNKELLIRFLIFKDIETEELKKIRQFSEFINDESIKLAQNQGFDYEKEESEFKLLFDKLDNALGENVFRRYNQNKAKFEGAFTVYMYEILALGLAPYLEQLSNIDDKQLAELIIEMWRKEEQTIYDLRAGKNLNLRIYNTIDFGRNYFSKLLK